MRSALEQFYTSACATLLGLTLLLALTLQGCGGGTTGTGGTGSSQFSGRISTSNGDPVAGASVVLEETGDNAISDHLGNFEIETELPGDSATFLVETATAQASTALLVPPGPHDVTLELKLDETRNTVSIASQSIKPPTKPRKTPTPRPKPTKVPTALPTAIVDPTLPPLPTEAPSPTAAPTETVEVTPIPTGPTPLPALTVTPTPLALTVFRGTVSGDADVLASVRLGLAGTLKRVRIQSDGTFFFRAPVETSKPLLEALSGGAAALVPLDEVTANATKVVLKLTITARSTGGVAVSINSIRIIE